MEKWQVRSFDRDLNPIQEYLKDSDVLLTISAVYGKCNGCDDRHIGAARIYNSLLQRSIVEALLISDDISIDEIAELTGIAEPVLSLYVKVFFDIERAFNSKIDMIDYIETGISYYSEEESEDELNIFLLLRWAISLGKEFVIWKFRLKPTEYAADRLYNVVMKEAFFYHKEKSMGNSDISLSEYLRSVNTLLSSVKGSTGIKKTSEDDAGFDILDQLGIIVEEKEAPKTTIDELEGEDFINNALQQEAT